MIKWKTKTKRKLSLKWTLIIQYRAQVTHWNTDKNAKQKNVSLWPHFTALINIIICVIQLHNGPVCQLNGIGVLPFISAVQREIDKRLLYDKFIAWCISKMY